MAQLIIVSTLLFLVTINGGKVVRLENGRQVITGKGCGISTTLKYMATMPKNPEVYECVIIGDELQIPKSDEERKLYSGDQSPDLI